jgi:hypothetical protein
MSLPKTGASNSAQSTKEGGINSSRNLSAAAIVFFGKQACHPNAHLNRLPSEGKYRSTVVALFNGLNMDHEVFFFFFWTSNMENLSQLITQEDYLGLQVLRITHHCYGLALNTSSSPHKEASAWKSCFTPRNTGPAGISPAKLHIIVGAASRYRTP